MAKAYIRKDSSVVWITFSFNGKRYRKATELEATEENRKVVQEELPAYMRKLKSGEVRLKDSNDNEYKTFNHYSALYRKRIKHLRDSTKDSYETKIAFWESTFGNKLIKDINASKIQEVLDDKDTGIGYKKELLKFCSRVFKRARMDKEINENPCELVEFARIDDKKEIHPFSKEEVSLLLDNSNGFFRNMLAVAFYTGIRTGELLALEWQNIDFENKTIFISNAVTSKGKLGKTKNKQSVRYVPMFNSLVPYLKEQQTRTGLNKFVFTTREATFYNSSNLYSEEWSPLLRKCNLPHRRLYETRHTFASNLIYSKQFSLNQVAKWLGHKGISTLVKTYNNFIEDESEFDAKIDVFDTKKVTQKIKQA